MGEVLEPGWRPGVGLGDSSRSSLQEGKEKDCFRVRVDFPSHWIAKLKMVSVLLVSASPYYCVLAGLAPSLIMWLQRSWVSQERVSWINNPCGWVCLLFLLSLYISGKSSADVEMIMGQALIFFLRTCITSQTLCRSVHEEAAVSRYVESSLWLHTVTALTFICCDLS